MLIDVMAPSYYPLGGSVIVAWVVEVGSRRAHYPLSIHQIHVSSEDQSAIMVALPCSIGEGPLLDARDRYRC